MNKNLKSDILKLGWYQVIGGAIGIIIVLNILFHLELAALGLNLLFYFVMILFFSYSVYCGILCIKLKTAALQFSLVNQFLQLLGFSFGGFTFKYVAGFFLSAGLDITNELHVSFNLGISTFQIYIVQEPITNYINFNLMALFLIYIIDKLKKEQKLEKEQEEIMSIGESS